MSNIVMFDAKQRPAYAMVKQEASDLTDSLAGGSAGFPKKVSIKGGVFRLVVDGKEVASIEERYLDVVIVRGAPHIGRTYYGAKYDEDKATAPECWSADGVAPDSSSINLQHTRCMDCPQNIKGSGTDDSRACRFSQRVAVVLANDIEGDVMQISLPAKSIFGKEEGDNRPLQAYVRFLKANNAKVEQFITRLKFDTDASTPKLFFKAMRWLEPAEHEVAREKGQSDEAIDAVSMSVSAPNAAKGEGLPPKPQAAITAKPVAAPAEEEEPPAPAATVGKKKPPAKVAPKPAAAASEPSKRNTSTPQPPATTARADIEAIAAKWDDADD